MKPAIRSASFHTFYLMQEYNIIGKKESILLHYGTVSRVHDLWSDIHMLEVSQIVVYGRAS